jgi:hypothetical protein
VLFRRLFPRESPWLGFVVPPLALVVVMNFIEHGVAIPSLRWLLPFTACGCVWLIASPWTRWKGLRLPTIIFLVAFAFTLFLRFLKPDIQGVRDGIYDLQFISSFCMGDTLPAESTWIPPLKLIFYYTLGHYGSSVLIRLFGFDIGTGFNVSAALLSAWIYLLIAAIAWQIGRRKLWITILALVLAMCAANGCTGLVWLVVDNVELLDVATIYSRLQDLQDHNRLFYFFKPVFDVYDRRELFPPGWWGWTGCFHSTSIGQFLVLLAMLSIAEMVRGRRSNWPWICGVACVPMMLLASTWGFPFMAVLVFTALVYCWRAGRVPRNWRAVLIGVGAVVALLTPMMLYYLTSSTPPHGIPMGDERTQVAEFILQWWPIYLPWLALLFTWRKIHPAVGIIMIVFPIAFLGVENYSFGARFDMTGKNWGFIFCAAWAVFIPAIAVRRFWTFRLLLALITINCVLSLCFWTGYYKRTVDWNDVGELEGKGDLRSDPARARILNALLPLKDQIITTGLSQWSWCESARIANFSGNRDYITWSFNCDHDMVRNGIGEGWRREKVLDEFYQAKNPNPVLYLRQRNIAAVVIWPDDNIADDVLTKLQQQLAPSYQYEDLREAGDHDSPNCGIFLYHSNLANELPATTNPAPKDD